MIIRSPQTIKEWEDYYDLRFQLLRKPWGQPKGSERTKEDTFENTYHFACFDAKEIVGVGRLDYIESDKAQIRFFAIKENRQGKGIGTLLLKEMEKYAISMKINKIILQARENAVSFYEKNGYQKRKKTHLLFGEIQHFLMEKEDL